MDSEKRNTLGQFVAFNLIGLANTLLGLLIYLWLTYIGVYYVAALVTIYILGIGFSFIMNKTYTFQINKTSGYSMIYKMICIYGLMFFLNIIVLFILVDIVHINQFLGQIVSCVVLSILSFLAQKFFIFKNVFN